MEPIGEFYTKWKAIEAMEAGYVCIFSAGTGSPYFTTDTGSSLRGIEILAERGVVSLDLGLCAGSLLAARASRRNVNEDKFR